MSQLGSPSKSSLWCRFFSFLSLLFIFSLPYRGCSAEEQRTPSHPVCLPPVSDTPHCHPMQGLPASLGTTSSVGPSPPYLLQGTARGSTHSVRCPLAAGHRVLEEERGLDPVSGAGSTAEALQFAPMESERLHQIGPMCMVLSEGSPSIRGLPDAMKLISLQAFLMHTS